MPLMDTEEEKKVGVTLADLFWKRNILETFIPILDFHIFMVDYNIVSEFVNG